MLETWQFPQGGTGQESLVRIENTDLAIAHAWF